MGPVYPPTQRPVPTTDSRAVLSLSLGIASMLCLGAIAGIPAIVFGAVARREVDLSQGTRSGRELAAAGIVTGLFGTGLSMVLVLWGAANLVAPAQPAATSEAAPRTVAAGARSSPTLEVVDLGADDALDTVLATQGKRARESGRQLVLQTSKRNCPACSEVASALPDPRMQRALANVTLVRVDIDVFGEELAALGVETETLPWFYKIDSLGHPVDGINADEWDDNIAANMAPVLGAFVRGHLGKRHTPSPIGTAL